LFVFRCIEINTSLALCTFWNWCDAHQQQRGATAVYNDNEGAIKLANNPMASNMTNNIYIKHHYIRELADARTIAVVSVGTADMLANGLTKALAEPKHMMTCMRCMGAAPSEGQFCLHLCK
jgi:phosphoribosylamine-glycine ligase